MKNGPEKSKFLKKYYLKYFLSKLTISRHDIVYSLQSRESQEKKALTEMESPSGILFSICT